MSNVPSNKQAGPAAMAANPGLKDLTKIYQLSNQVEGKSPKTTVWYDEMLRAFISYLAKQRLEAGLSAYNIDVIRGYVLYLQRAGDRGPY